MSSGLAVRQLTLRLGISRLRSPLKDSALSYGFNEKRREIERESPDRLVSAALRTSARPDTDLLAFLFGHPRQPPTLVCETSAARPAIGTGGH